MLALALPFVVVYALLFAAVAAFMATAYYAARKKYYQALLADSLGLGAVLVISLASRTLSADLIETNATQFLVMTIGSTLLMVAGMCFLIYILIKAVNVEKEKSN